jgi:hypothetical protein
VVKQPVQSHTAFLLVPPCELSLSWRNWPGMFALLSNGTCSTALVPALQPKPANTNTHIFIFIFCSTGDCTQGLELARQALYHLTQVLSPTCNIFLPCKTGCPIVVVHHGLLVYHILAMVQVNFPSQGPRALPPRTKRKVILFSICGLTGKFPLVPGHACYALL